MNVFDYLKWRDDILFTSLNEIDSLIFNRISYFPLETIMSSEDKLTIEECYKRCNDNTHYNNKLDKELFRCLSISDRYKDLILCNIKEKFNRSIEEQFFGLTIELPNNTCYISFRGSTSNIISWKEDFNMSFIDEIPAQKDALEYVNSLSTYSHIYIGGHSKGGNLAMYAGINCKKDIKDKIIKIYNFDGPGFMNLTDNYYKMKDKIISYIPGSSIIGRLLNLDNETIVVKSNSLGIGEHNLYTWEVLKTSFVNDKLHKESNKIKSIMDEWINKMSINERKDFINGAFDIFINNGVEKIKDIKINDIKEIITSYKNMDEETKKLLFTMLGYLLNSTKEHI